jgi:hypothetical protein
LTVSIPEETYWTFPFLTISLDDLRFLDLLVADIFFNFLKLNRKEREYKKRKERKNTNYFARFA